MDYQIKNLFDSESYYFRHQIPEGWYKCFGKEFLDDLKEFLERNNCLESAVLGDIKEKYGSLTFDLDNIPEEWYAHNAAWEYISEHTCIKCGKFPVSMREERWICPWCDECYEKEYGSNKNSLSKERLLEYAYYPSNDSEGERFNFVDLKPYYEKIGFNHEDEPLVSLDELKRWIETSINY